MNIIERQFCEKKRNASFKDEDKWNWNVGEKTHIEENQGYIVIKKYLPNKTIF